MVWLGFLICFLPTTLIMIFNPMPPEREYPGLHVAGYIIFWCSGFSNPVIYIISNKYYRKAMQEMVCCEPNNNESIQRVSYHTRDQEERVSLYN